MRKKFLEIFSESFENSKLSTLTVSSVIKNVIVEDDLKSILIKPYTSKNGRMLSWVYKHSRKDITKNHTIVESVRLLEELIGIKFAQADMYCTDKEYFLKTKGKGKLTIKDSKVARIVTEEHNRVKTRLVDESEEFLKLLGITSNDGYLKKERRDKYIQINKFLEFFSNAVKTLDQDTITVLDMGSGKGYLTFAVFNYLKNSLNKNGQVVGVEYRQDMVNLCNSLADKAGFFGLNFMQGTIANYNIETNDVLIALHACDTATDEALFKGIKADSKVIMTSPCCHKQVRKAMDSKGFTEIFSKHGIIKERIAEMLTDLIRTTILEIYGYQTQIFEFVNADHTPKNLMITAVKRNESQAHFPEAWNKVEEIKQQFGIKYHYLQRLLLENKDEISI